MSFEQIKIIIDDWDPLELLSIHCPSDEYDTESKAIWEKVQYIENTNQIGNVIFNEFTMAFGEDVFKKSMADCLTIAQKIIDKSTS